MRRRLIISWSISNLSRYAGPSSSTGISTRYDSTPFERPGPCLPQRSHLVAQAVLVKGWKGSAGWGFPKGKINQTESLRQCAIREVGFYYRFQCIPLIERRSMKRLALTLEGSSTIMTMYQLHIIVRSSSSTSSGPFQKTPPS